MSRLLSRQQPARTSFRRYSLRHEWLAAAAATALLIGAGAVSLALLRGRYLDLQKADANRVKHHLQVHIEEAGEQLQEFLNQPEKQWQRLAGPLLPSFSDLYELDDQLTVQQVFKASQGSRVFPGFSFAGAATATHLRVGGQLSRGSTPIIRGLEDELTSIYVLEQRNGRRILGRIQLGYIKRFLQRYSAFSGTPTLLVSRDGFVMLSGYESLRVANIDLRRSFVAPGWAGTLQPLELGKRSWLPVASDETVLGARIVTLLPSDQLLPLRQVLGTTGALVLLLWALIVLWKNHRLGRQLFDPVAQFAERIRAEENRLRQGGLPLATAEDLTADEGSRFRELATLQSSFERLIAAIHERDLSLQQAREREQRNEERQRQLLQSKLHSSLIAATVAHEINLPLGTIRMLCKEASEQLGHHDRGMNVEELVTSLNQHSQQVSGIIEKMRMLLRNVQTEPRPTDPVAVLQSSRRSVKPLLREHAVALEVCGLESSSQVMLQGDAVQLQMAVANLLRNGIEAAAEMPPGRRQVRLALVAEPGELVVEVADSGGGFGFEPSGDTLLQSSKAGGSGLGLFVVRTTLEHHHGRLSFGRCPHLGGARVRMHLPLVQRELQDKLQQEPQQEPQQHHQQGAREWVL
jgi:signal transduction histidine kinase